LGARRYERLPGLAAELVGKPVRVLATVGGEPAGLAAKAATSTIPIVFSMGEPVQLGLVESYNRPGGNITGIDVMATELEAKRTSLLHDLVPQATTIGFLLNPALPEAKAQQRAVEEAAHALKLQVLILGANSDGEIEKTFETGVEQHIGALAIASAPFFDTRRAKLLALQSQYQLPTAHSFREYAAEVQLISTRAFRSG
jgi:putative ABC transport system substrate-binding protein